jgi:hypothetical protein
VRLQAVRLQVVRLQAQVLRAAEASQEAAVRLQAVRLRAVLLQAVRLRVVRLQVVLLQAVPLRVVVRAQQAAAARQDAAGPGTLEARRPEGPDAVRSALHPQARRPHRVVLPRPGGSDPPVDR